MHCGLDRSQGRRKSCLDEQRVLASIKKARVWLQWQGHGLLITRCTIWGLSQAFLRTKRNVWQKLLHEVRHVFHLFSANYFPPFFRNKVWLPCLKTRLLMSQFPSVQSAPDDFRILGWKNRNREFYRWLYKMASSANSLSDVIIIDGSIMEGVRRTYLWVIPFTKTVPIKLSFWDKFFVSTYCMRSVHRFWVYLHCVILHGY